MPMVTTHPPPLTLADVAQQSGMHRNTISRYLSRGEFPGAYRASDNGPWRIPQSAFDSWQRKRQMKR